MDEVLDADIRREVFAFLEKATASMGDVLPWGLLTKGFTYKGERVCLIGASGIWKPKILPFMPISICTAPPRPGRAAPYQDSLDANGRLTYCYRGTDTDHPDNVGLREAMLRGTPLVYFFGTMKGQYLPTWPVFIVGDDPLSLTFQVSVDDRMLARDPAAEGTLVREARREYMTTLAIRRLHQQTFRARVLRAYRQTCAFCRLRHAELLDAAHIVPDSDPHGEPLVSNGLALCKIHHAAFDGHILGVRPDLVIEVRRDILDEIDGPMLEYGLQKMHGERIHIPNRQADRPAARFVEERYATFRQAC